MGFEFVPLPREVVAKALDSSARWLSIWSNHACQLNQFARLRSLCDFGFINVVQWRVGCIAIIPERNISQLIYHTSSLCRKQVILGDLYSSITIFARPKYEVATYYERPLNDLP